jgi:type IV pilus assembly protein PilM
LPVAYRQSKGWLLMWKPLSVPTEVANLLANMQVNPRINRPALANDGPAMMLAVGLALRSFQ